MNKTKGAFESPELCSPGGMQSTSLTSVAPPFAFIQQAMDKVLNVILIVVLFIIMVSLGCTMEIAKITTHLRKRKGMALAVMAQYGIMPLTAFILAKLFQLGATESLAGFFLHLSIVMTTCSTGDLEGKVPYKGTVTSLVLMLIPCVISIILNEKKPHYTGFIIKVRSILCWLPFNQGLQASFQKQRHRNSNFFKACHKSMEVGQKLAFKKHLGNSIQIDSKGERQAGGCILSPQIPQLLHLPNHQTPMRPSETATSTYTCCRCRQALPASKVVSSPPALGGLETQRDLDRDIAMAEKQVAGGASTRKVLGYLRSF
uniref:Uncharacterized protein n=1 Tax=Strix occidentalis caurina TaxID=311401 RepID=A0A8D0FHQ2_STROC